MSPSFRTSLSLFTLSLLFFFSLSVSAHSGHRDDDDDDDADAGGDATPNLRARSLILAKVWCLIVIFFATFVSGVSPYILKWNEGFLVLGTQFAGGVFLGTAMMHFLSDANETFGDLTRKEYPFAFMLACAGYLMTLLADAVISSVLKNTGRDQPRDAEDVQVQGICFYSLVAMHFSWYYIYIQMLIGALVKKLNGERFLLECSKFYYS